MAQEIQHPRPAADWETRAWWEGCGRGELVLQRCNSCDIVQFRPRAVCAKCLSNDLEHFVASGRGHIYTFTVTYQNQVPPFREACPYVLAYVELEEGPRLMTNIVECDPESVTVGMPVVADFQAVESKHGDVFAVPRFRPE